MITKINQRNGNTCISLAAENLAEKELLSSLGKRGIEIESCGYQDERTFQLNIVGARQSENPDKIATATAGG